MVQIVVVVYLYSASRDVSNALNVPTKMRKDEVLRSLVLQTPVNCDSELIWTSAATMSIVPQ